MGKLLDIDKKLVKEFGIEADLTVEEKKKYLDDQIESTLHVLWRLRVDTMMSSTVEAKTEDEKAENEQKTRAYRNDIKLLSKALKEFISLRDEL